MTLFMKKFLTIMTICVLILSIAMFATGCGSTDEGSGDVSADESESVANGYVTFEAEGIDFTGLSSSGPSNAYVGTAMIWGENTAANFDNDETVLASISNGYCIGTMTNSSNDITFTINSDVAATDCEMKIRISLFNGSKFDNNTMTLNDDIMSIAVNGTALDYDDISVKGGSTDKTCTTVFKDYSISTTFDLVAGENTIVFKVVENDTAAYIESSGADGGAPALDCIKIKSTSVVSWDSKWTANALGLGIIL